MGPLAEPQKDLAADRRVADACLRQASQLPPRAESVTGATYTSKTVVVKVNDYAAVTESTQFDRVDAEL
eukprot:9454970-Pyramimonas_sp.AAC.1